MYLLLLNNQIGGSHSGQVTQNWEFRINKIKRKLRCLFQLNHSTFGKEQEESGDAQALLTRSLVWDGYVYRKVKEDKNLSVWRCLQSNKKVALSCKAKAQLCGGVVTLVYPHNHGTTSDQSVRLVCLAVTHLLTWKSTPCKYSCMEAHLHMLCLHTMIQACAHTHVCAHAHTHTHTHTN